MWGSFEKAPGRLLVVVVEEGAKGKWWWEQAAAVGRGVDSAHGGDRWACGARPAEGGGSGWLASRERDVMGFGGESFVAPFREHVKELKMGRVSK